MVDIKTPAWSHTSLTAFETCPKKYYHTRVKKDIPDPPGEAALWGQRVHKSLEERAKDNIPLPDYLSHCEPVIQQILSKDGQRLIEEQIALNRDLRPVGWFDKKAWCRGVVDIGVVNEKNAVLLDWKTGKRKPDNDQMKLFAAFSFAKFPWVKKITTAFVWLKENKTDKEVFDREKHESGIWQEVMPRVIRLEQAYVKDSWPAKPSGLCKNYCPVRSCEFCGK